MPIEDEMQPWGRVKIGSLPAVENMACIVHAGPFATLSQAYDALGKWIGENGYQVIGPARELNLRLPETPGDQHDPNTLNEIQFPVEKA